MNVAVCRTKLGAAADALYIAFISGLGIYGDTWMPIEGGHPNDILDRLQKCDLSMQVCEGHLPAKDGTTRGNAFRSRIREFQNTIQKRRLVLETGFVKNNVCRNLPINQKYFQVGYDGMKGMSKCYNKNSPNDRWSALDVKVKPWRKSGSHVLIMGQNIHGASTRNTDVLKWWEGILPRIRKLTDRPIKMRPHPTQKNFPKSDVAYEITKRTEMEDDLKDCWCVVARSTSGAVDAIINGIPVITPDEMCMTYPVSSHSIEDINDPVSPDRSQWFNDLAYAQWSVEEIKAGIPWGRLRRFAKK